MSRLRELQRQIGRTALDQPASPALILALRDDRPIPLRDRLRVHRNNTMTGLIDPLAASFPVVQQLVGAAFFAQMAQDFIRAHPPGAPALLTYGQELAAFITDYRPAASVPYLADMARLEYALAVGYHAADRPVLAPSALQLYEPEQLEQLCLTPHPSLRFVASDFPLFAIWQAHQPDSGSLEAVDLTQGGDHLLVYRPVATQLIRAVSPGCFAFMMTLATGQPLAAAYQSALTGDPDFSIETELAALLAADIFVDAKLA